MHIVYVTTELCEKNNPSKGGLASYIANMSAIMQEHGHLVEILYITTKEVEIANSSNVLIYNVFVPKYEWDEYNTIANGLFSNDRECSNSYRKTIVDIRKAQLVKQWIEQKNKENKIDIVQFANLGGYSLLMDQSVPYVVRISGYNNICEVGAELPEGFLSFANNPVRDKDILELRALQRARFTISPSHLCAKLGREGIGIDPTVIESPFSSKFVFDDRTYDERLYGKKYILFVGALNRNKGIHVVAELAKRFLDNNPDKYIVLAGDDRIIKTYHGDSNGSEYVFQCAGEYGERVVYLGNLSREQLYSVEQHALLVLLPSRIDNLPNACIEAMALGQMVVGTDGASYEQIIEDGVNGFLCERDNADSFLTGINKALELSEVERDLIKTNAKATIERMSPDKIYEKYIKYYTYVIDHWNYI